MTAIGRKQTFVNVRKRPKADILRLLDQSSAIDCSGGTLHLNKS